MQRAVVHTARGQRPVLQPCRYLTQLPAVCRGDGFADHHRAHQLGRQALTGQVHPARHLGRHRPGAYAEQARLVGVVEVQHPTVRQAVGQAGRHRRWLAHPDHDGQRRTARVRPGAVEHGVQRVEHRLCVRLVQQAAHEVQLVHQQQRGGGQWAPEVVQEPQHTLRARHRHDVRTGALQRPLGEGESHDMCADISGAARP